MTAPTDANYSILSYGEDEAENEAAERQGMTTEDLLAVCRDELTMAVGYGQGGSANTVEQRRANLLRRYLGEPYGNEVEGYSQVVSRDVFEVVEWALPQLIETFIAGDKVARFDPMGAEDEKEAEQQTELANHVFLRENAGFLIFATMFKDALTQEIGVTHQRWETSLKAEYEVLEGLTPEQITMYVQGNPELELAGAVPSGVAPGLWDVEVRRTFDAGCIQVVNIPPEHFFYSPDARSIEDARCCGFIEPTTASRLVEMGYDPEVVEMLSGDSNVPTTDGELARVSRDEGDTGQWARNNRRDSEREITFVEMYVEVDFDGDGISELRKVCLVSNGANVTKILHHEPAPFRPFAVISPIQMPHRLAGMSLSETVEDIAQIRTAFLRAYIDGTNLNLRPRSIVLGDAANGPMANIDELLSVIPGGVVTEYAPGAIRPFTNVDTTATSLAALEMMKGMREERTGITRTWQGTEAPNSLNDTATGMRILANHAGMRIAYIARIFAETGVKQIFKQIAALLKLHQRIPKAIRLRGQWANVDPTTWRNDYDAIIEVGLGYGDKQSAIANMQQVLLLQEKAAVLAPQLVGPDKAFEAVSELLKHMGYKNADRFFNDPATTPPPPDEPSDEEKKLAQEAFLKTRELEVRELEVRLDYEVEMAKLGIAAKAPQPDPVPVPPAIEMDLGSMTDAMTSVKEAASSLHTSMGPLADQMAALRDAMSKPRRVERDAEGRIIGTTLGEA